MEAYRDQYATLFNNGNGVTVLAISADSVEMQQAWAAEAKFPQTFVSDPAAVAGIAYDVKYPAFNSFRRVVFVIDKEGKVSHIMRPFRELSADSYIELADAVKKAGGGG